MYDHHGDQEDLIVSIAMQPVADLASYLNIPLFGWMSSDYRLDNKTRESTLVRVMPPLSDLGKNVQLDSSILSFFVSCSSYSVLTVEILD